VILHTGALQLAVQTEGEDVVAYEVLAPVVLVVPARLHIVDEVALEDDLGATLVVVEPPAAPTIVIVRVDMVDVVVADRSAGRGAERVDTPHVAQHAPADVMDVVVVDGVVGGEALRVAPAPAHRDACVVEIGDLIMGDLVASALADPHADRFGEDASQGPENIVVDNNAGGSLRRIAPDHRLPDADTSRARILDHALGQLRAVTAASEPDAIGADMPKTAVVEGHVSGAVDLDDSSDAHRSLPITDAVLRQAALSVEEGKALEAQVPDPQTDRGLPHDTQEALRYGRDDLGGLRGLTVPRVVQERAVLSQEPLSGRVKSRLVPLEVVTLAGRPLLEGPCRCPARNDHTRLVVDGRDGQVRRGPGVIGHNPGANGHVLNVRGTSDEGGVRQQTAFSRVRVSHGSGLAAGVVVELVRLAGRNGSLAVHP